MLFNSFVFFAFLAIVLAGYAAMRGPRLRAAWLLAASYAFYAYWDWRFCFLLAALTLVDFSVGRALAVAASPQRRRLLLGVSLVANLGALAFFKYFNFFLDGAQAVAAAAGVRLDVAHLSVILPLGISFVTFRDLTYTVDVYRRRLEPTRSLLDYALFVSFFPTLVAGPIERAGRLLPQLAALRSPTRGEIGEGLVLISLGYFKKVLIGDAAGRIVDAVFGQPELYRSPELLAAAILFAVQIYADFNGYSDIARGIGKLFGVHLMQNFEQPYLSRSFSEFWRRWHISLSTWIWDYVFNPLVSACLRRLGRWRLPTVQREMQIAYPAAAMVTMLLCGLWHGAGVTFLVWGGLHGLCLSFERLVVYRGKAIPLKPRLRGPGSVVGLVAGLLTTQLLVAFAWLFFRAESLDQVSYFLAQFASWRGSELTGRFAVITASFLAMTLLLDALEYATGSHAWLLKLRPAAAAGICTAAMAVVVLYLATVDPMPFVYFQF
ncbi:MAG TPA: MBOAT family O-acyltransferase [Candidatus Krumholzibacteria bacterium]|nr:MBOAT family O-acyltransferase [Candidatus Krumholzibacteria bacterium]HPD71885.1 MBOAT family O-acyltransferase [Candidatus Krumholzibacteria bacterium]HRY41182.1 MBOAT family O-acyltransferase [Candidatus Krumholzibacteria bacterium]